MALRWIGYYIEYCNTDRLYFSPDMDSHETQMMAFHKREVADEIRHQNPMDGGRYQ